MRKKDTYIIMQALLTGTILLGITTILYLYSRGYRLNKEQNTPTIDFKTTGMINAKSIPDGATVYLDGNVRTATNNTIAGIAPGTHTLKLVKKGYVTWTKTVDVFPELVTDITAVLVSKTPRIEPLTETGAKNPEISPDGTLLAYFSNDPNTPGIRIVDLASPGINLFRSNTTIIAEDTRFAPYSQGNKLKWSPDGKQILVTNVKDKDYLITIESKEIETVANASKVLEKWKEQEKKNKKALLEKLDIPDELRQIATDPDTLWAPDSKKFLYIDKNNNYKVYNMEDPLPIGEKVETIVFRLNKGEQKPQITWYPDSFHLILTYTDVQKKEGSIYIIRIDGTNKTELFRNSLYANKAFVTPHGDKIIVVTTFKTQADTNLYTVSIH